MRFACVRKFYVPLTETFTVGLLNKVLALVEFIRLLKTNKI
jgi:hypothetical protein